MYGCRETISLRLSFKIMNQNLLLFIIKCKIINYLELNNLQFRRPFVPPIPFSFLIPLILLNPSIPQIPIQAIVFSYPIT